MIEIRRNNFFGAAVAAGLTFGAANPVSTAEINNEPKTELTVRSAAEFVRGCLNGHLQNMAIFSNLSDKQKVCIDSTTRRRFEVKTNSERLPNPYEVNMGIDTVNCLQGNGGESVQIFKFRPDGKINSICLYDKSKQNV